MRRQQSSGDGGGIVVVAATVVVGSQNRDQSLEQARANGDVEQPTTDDKPPTPISDRRPTPVAVLRTPSPRATSELTVCDILRSNLAATPAYDQSTTPSDHATTTLVKKPPPSDDVVRPPWSFHHSYPGYVELKQMCYF